MQAETKDHLLDAMKGEAYAYARYMLFAEQARRNGRTELADLFEHTAAEERMEHFAEEAKLLGLSHDDLSNLLDAIEGEAFEVETMYKEYADEAVAAGDIEVAKQFNEIRQDEAKHRDAFDKARHMLMK